LFNNQKWHWFYDKFELAAIGCYWLLFGSYLCFYYESYADFLRIFCGIFADFLRVKHGKKCEF